MSCALYCRDEICVQHLRDVDDFPIGARVLTPTGRPGVVIAHKGAQSRLDAHERCVVRHLDGGGRDRDTVTLQPHLLQRVENNQK